MRPALEQFEKNVANVRNLLALHAAIRKQTSQVVDLSDILRASFVFAVSALDHYIHELVRLGMREMHAGKRPATKAFLRFTVSLKGTRRALANPSTDEWLDEEIRVRHGWQSFQQPENISKALRLIHSNSIWQPVAVFMRKRSADTVKQQLSLIIERRNKISHEADVDPTYPSSRWPIDVAMVSDSVDFIHELAKGIFSVIVGP